MTENEPPNSNGHEVSNLEIEQANLLDRDVSEGTEPPVNEFPVLVQHLAAPLDAGIQPVRTIGVLGLAFLAYVAVCGGPYGIEPAVGAAGPLITLISLVVAAIFWALPQSLLTAELSTIYDENGGYVVWVQEGLGPFWGFVHGYNALVANFCDLPGYPVLYAGYLQQFFSMGAALDWTVKLLTLGLVVILNILGMETVTITSIIFTFIVLTPFVIEPFLVPVTPSDWVGTTKDVDWGVLVSAVLWNYQGWNTLGCVAGEVKNAKKSYPIGVIIATFMVVFTYAIPIMVGTTLEPDWEKWGNGIDFVDIAHKITKWLGVLALLGASFALIGEFSAAFSSSSRALQRMSGYGMVPHFLVKNRTKFATPLPSILCEAVTTGFLMALNISTLMIITTLFNNIAIVFQIIAFLYLKFKYPDMNRPYSVPFGKSGALLVAIPQLLVIAYAGYTIMFRWHIGLGAGLNVLFCLAGYWWTHKYLPKAARRYTAEQNDELHIVVDSMELGTSHEPVVDKHPDIEDPYNSHTKPSEMRPQQGKDQKRRKSCDGSPQRKYKSTRKSRQQRCGSTSHLSLFENDNLMTESSSTHIPRSPLDKCETATQQKRYGSCTRH